MPTPAAVYSWKIADPGKAGYAPKNPRKDPMQAPQGEEWRVMDESGTKASYLASGEELDAARSRIDTVRRGDIELRLQDFAGKPISGLTVELVQTRSAFDWGDQLWGLDSLLRHGHRDSDRVRHFSHLFSDCLNSANCLSYWTEAPRNDGPKHMEFQGVDQMDNMAAQVEWALSQGLKPKGHPVFWSLPKAYPEWLKRYPIDTQWKFIEVRVRNLIARFKGKVRLWDIVNEPMWEAAPKNLPNRFWPEIESFENICEYIIPVLQWAREEDPDACYVVNDYGLEVDQEGRELRDRNGRLVTAAGQRERFVTLFHKLREAGASPDALGMQAHTGAWMSPSQQLKILDELSSAGVPLHYTEFWAKIDSLLQKGIPEAEARALQAEYIAQVMTMAFSHPSVEAFFFWGDLTGSFGFKQDHNSNGIPSSSNNPTAVYRRVRQLLKEEWMTRETATSDEDGRIRLRAFHGEYSLRYRQSGSMHGGLTFSHTAGVGGPVTLRLHRPILA